MLIKNNYKATIAAAFLGYITQAIMLNFPPLLYIFFQDDYGLSLAQVSVLISANIVVELVVDIIVSKIAARVGYRPLILLATMLATLGLLSMFALPTYMDNKFLALVLSMMLCGAGGGIMEVLISPIVEACPTKNKSGMMSLLHSFYCWGQMGVTLLSTLFFKVVGIEHWKLLACIWAIIPAIGAIAFSIVPIYTLEGDSTKARSGGKKQWGLFAVFFILMTCAGAAEMAMSQWASSFAEASLGIDKTTGDLLGPCFFAFLMGSSRIIHARISTRIALKPVLIFSAALCAVSYLIAALAPIPMISLLGCALCGLSVGVMWPGTYSLAAKNITNINMSAFALLAIGGDLGCTLGPSAVGWIAEQFGGNLKISFLISAIFPILILSILLIYGKKIKNRKKDA